MPGGYGRPPRYGSGMGGMGGMGGMVRFFFSFLLRSRSR